MRIENFIHYVSLPESDDLLCFGKWDVFSSDADISPHKSPQRVFYVVGIEAGAVRTWDLIFYYRVFDIQKAIYEVNDFASSVPSLAKTTLRAVIGKMTLTEANENRDRINEEVEKILDLEVSKWGISVVRVELQRIEPPADVQMAMNQVVKAENEKIAALDLATAIETQADGERRAEIKKAEGIAAAIKLKAEADGEAIKVVNEAAEKYFVGNAQLLKKLETVSEALRDNSKIIVPSDSDLVNVIGDLAGATVPITK